MAAQHDWQEVPGTFNGFKNLESIEYKVPMLCLDTGMQVYSHCLSVAVKYRQVRAIQTERTYSIECPPTCTDAEMSRQLRFRNVQQILMRSTNMEVRRLHKSGPFPHDVTDIILFHGQFNS